MPKGVRAKAEDLEPIPLEGGGELRRDPARPSYGWVKCPDCKNIKYKRIPSYGSKQFKSFTGRDCACEQKRRDKGGVPLKYEYPATDQPVGEYGSFAYWSRRKGPSVPVKCGWCNRIRPFRATLIFRPGFTGLHNPCFLEAYGIKKMFTHEAVLLQGTKVLWHLREPGDRHKIGIECRGCFARTQQIKYVFDKQIQSHVHWLLGLYALLRWQVAQDATAWCYLWPYLKRMLFWDELCSDCVKARGALYKFTGPMTADSGTVTHFDDEVDGQVLVTYSDPENGCGCERRVNRDDAVTHWSKYPAVCRYHHQHPVAYLEARRRLMGNGNGQKDRNATKSKAGRPPELKDHLVYAAIDRLAARVSVAALARTLECSRPAINNWVRRQGYPDLKSLLAARRAA